MTAEANTVKSTLSLKTYRLTAIKKAAYRLADRVTVTLGTVDADMVPIQFLFSRGSKPETVEEAMRDFYRELTDQELREQIAEDTVALRTLIMAQAFSRLDLVRRD